jgi:hypothetical protein
MATLVLFDDFGLREGKGEIDLSTDTFKAMLTNTAVAQATNTVKTDLTDLTTANGYTAGGQTLTCTWAETSAGSGVWRFAASADITWTASGGSIGPYQYMVIYDDTHASDALVGYVDHGSAATLTDTNTHTWDLDANFELFTKTIPAAV